MSSPAEREIQRQIMAAEKLYDNNDYVHGLKNINKLLQKHPNHPEALALKALFLNAQKKKDEAATIIQQALRAGMKNAKIWKFQGIIHKNNHEYTKATQCLTMSQKLDNTDTTVIQDLCNLYLFERNYKLFAEASRQLLKTNTYPSAIVRYAVALQLNGKIQTAIQFLTTYERNLMPTENDEELIFRSELSLHHAGLLFQTEKYAECEEYLVKNRWIRDSVSKNEWLVKACLAQGKRGPALERIDELIAVYPENGDYFTVLEKELSAEEYMEKLFRIKDERKSRYAEVRILELMDVADERFEKLLAAYLVPYLRKGAPSIFVYLAELSAEKLDVAVTVAKAADVPLCYVPIVHNFAADVMIARGNYEAALEEANAGIAHTPTCLEVTSTKIRILKKMGRISEAAELAKNLMKFDPADRNTNTILMNALLWNGELKEAVVAAKPFSVDHDGKLKLFHTQYNEACLRCADCAFRAGDSKMALKFYNDVVDHFEAFRKSQFNYLGWAMKRTVSLMEMLKWADNLVTNPVFARAARGIMKISFAEDNDVKDLALKMTNATEPEVLAFTATYFARAGEPLPALKCFLKIQGSPKFAAAPAVAKMMSDLSKVPELVREVATELYQPFATAPETIMDLVMSARGCMLIGDLAGAREKLLHVASMHMTFKEAVEVYSIAKFELKQDDLAEQIETAVHTNDPLYELQIKGKYEPPDELPSPDPGDE